MQHLEEGTIHAWLDGALSTTEAREVEQHVASCSECSAVVAEARGLIAGASRIVSSLDVVRGNVIPKAPASKGGGSLWRSLHLTPARAALAATLMIAISSLLVIRHDTPEKMIVPPATVAVAPAPDTIKPQAAPAAPAPAFTPAPKVTTTPGPRSALASSAVKDQANKPSEPAPVAADAKAKADVDVIERRDALAAAKVPASADSVREAEKRMAVGAAAPMSAGAPSANAQAPEKKELPRLREDARLQINEVVATGVVSGLAGAAGPPCFEFVPRLTDSKVPQRFALLTVPGDTTRHIIRAVTDDGKIDSVLAGSEWTRTPTEITVRFAANERASTLQVRDASLGAASTTANRFARQASLSVNRVVCRP